VRALSLRKKSVLNARKARLKRHS